MFGPENQSNEFKNTNSMPHWTQKNVQSSSDFSLAEQKSSHFNQHNNNNNIVIGRASLRASEVCECVKLFGRIGVQVILTSDTWIGKIHRFVDLPH